MHNIVRSCLCMSVWFFEAAVVCVMLCVLDLSFSAHNQTIVAFIFFAFRQFCFVYHISACMMQSQKLRMMQIYTRGECQPAPLEPPRFLCHCSTLLTLPYITLHYLLYLRLLYITYFTVHHSTLPYITCFSLLLTLSPSLSLSLPRIPHSLTHTAPIIHLLQKLHQTI